METPVEYHCHNVKNTDIVITKQETAYSRKSGQDLWAPVKGKAIGIAWYQWYKGVTPIKTNIVWFVVLQG